MPGAPDWAGTALVHRFNQVFSFGVPIGAGQSLYLGNPAVTKPGYVMNFRPQYSGANGTFPFCRLRIRWLDLQTSVDMGGPVELIIPVLTNTAYSPFIGMGPIRGSTMSIHVDNLDTLQPITPFTDAFECTQDIARDDWRGPVDVFGTLAPPGFTPAPGNNISQNLLVSAINQTVTPAAGQTWILPLYAGQAYLTIGVTGTAGVTVNLNITPLPNPPGYAPTFSFQGTLPLTNGGFNQQVITMPRQPCQMQLSQVGAGSSLWTVSLIAQEYAS